MEEGRDVERTTQTVRVSTRVATKLASDESKSDVTNTVGEPQIQCIDRVDTVVRGRWCFLFSQEACVYS